MVVSYVCVWVAGGGGDAKRLYGGGAKRFSAAFGFSSAAFRSIWVLVRSVSQHLGSRAQRFAAFGFSSARKRKAEKWTAFPPSALVKS
jgi:hypothetical protein